MKRGKVAGRGTLIAEHLQHCHSLLACVLAKLFNWFTHLGYLPKQFGLCYTVPLLKGKIAGKNITVDDFRGISISPVISMVFELRIIS
jgi:hypothetical protein